MDFSAIEPTLTAHYSQDPSLLKVFRDGLGDVYLDRALMLFPDDAVLRELYNPNTLITEDVKENLKKQRKIAKIIQLAAQYTGTGRTVSISLTKAGFPTTVAEADKLVARYWESLKPVQRMNEALKALHKKRGYLINAVGRPIRVHPKYEKDVPNRFFQSSGHDILSLLFILKVAELCKERGIVIRPVLLDIHDASATSCLLQQVEDLKKVYTDAISWVNLRLNMTVALKAEVKTFTTLAIKGDG